MGETKRELFIMPYQLLAVKLAIRREELLSMG